jgi:hypothetical protein
MPRVLRTIGALFYLVWAALHFQAAYGVGLLGDTVPASMIQGRLFQDAWTLYAAASVIAVISVITIFRDWPLGYWLNLGIAGITDIGFIVYILVPGYAPLWPGAQGPVAWIIGLAFSTAALLLAKRPEPRKGMTS